MRTHIAIYTSNNTDTDVLSKRFFYQKDTLNQVGLRCYSNIQIFSKKSIQKLIFEEDVHDRFLLKNITNQRLSTMSSGEQCKAVLKYLLAKNPDLLILEKPFDYLDKVSKKKLLDVLENKLEQFDIIQFFSRSEDVLPFVFGIYTIDDTGFQRHTKEDFINSQSSYLRFEVRLPISTHVENYDFNPLISFKKVSVAYDQKPILKDISWKIKHGEFWQLIGNNGTGKTTLLSIIIGDSVKGYGQDLKLFGKQKGTGESVWEIKKNIGYFTTNIAQKFNRYQTVLEMVVGGFFDTVGLYQRPSKLQMSIANDWLRILKMEDLKNKGFVDLTETQKRLLMIARAVIKSPLLLILDEPTSGLDEQSSAIVISLIKNISKETKTAIIYVSHREEPLMAAYIFKLEETPEGSIGYIL